MPEAQCAAVNANRLAISLTGMPVISGGKNIGWASVRIMDPDYNIVSDEGQSETIVDNNPPSQDTANKAMADAANEAIKNFDVNLAIGQVLEYRAAAQKAAHP
ncbi:hypothetical protein DVT68_13280 [Dyella solisilvae]|uniref:Uncharacterized protein n=2 Tax=Dyella solisilvae TaxID=1920168 RepID=A0A370K7N8_9GAMM|nr:hypothetical protein DVT68_13280 [Dyella solisilvae]